MTSSSASESINWLGLWTLFRREIWRFSKVWNQTVLAPVVTSLLFLGVLVLALGEQRGSVGNLDFSRFVAPGLIMMAVLQNAFANTSSSLMLSKIQGVIIDILMPPLKGFEITLAMTAGGIVRGSMVALSVGIAVYMFIPFTPHNLWLGIFYLVMSSMLMALLGMLGGVVAQTFDQMSAFTNYIITPLTFLSGTFYSIHRLPEFWQTVSHYNPFFYMIDGFRYALTGHADGNIEAGITFLIAMNIIMMITVSRLFSRGWRLKV